MPEKRWNRQRADGLTNGEWMEKRKSESRCLKCGAKLSYRYDADPKTGCLEDFCTVCRPLVKPPPRPSTRKAKERERQRGLDNLDRILGKL